MVLWLMRWSAKLNLFLGVTNFHEEWLPKSQRYLASYINQRRINKLLPFSLLIGAIFSGYFFLGATHAAEGGDRVGRLIIGFLLALGVIEHLFLVLPVNDSKLWHWALAAATGNKGDDRLDIQTPAPPPRVAEQRGG
jgi:putative photosynthetic complex assembly protein 2